mgnify:CR=1 FL=1
MSDKEIIPESREELYLKNIVLVLGDKTPSEDPEIPRNRGEIYLSDVIKLLE